MNSIILSQASSHPICICQAESVPHTRRPCASDGVLLFHPINEGTAPVEIGTGEEERRKNLEFSLFWSVIFSENLDVFESEDLGTGNCDFRHLWFELDWKW
ncbi:hypothetical protein H5410_034105 [Solanum commersonii]|uniref:Uncharacterized protein n=1 Tax=Solanum commersonii TaxID=4109 RepID=A0A9J5YSH2_SOLCO|nr:hypothetical protein H5410_034105 [Solanum commersonii]